MSKGSRGRSVAAAGAVLTALIVIGVWLLAANSEQGGSSTTAPTAGASAATTDPRAVSPDPSGSTKSPSGGQGGPSSGSPDPVGTAGPLVPPDVKALAPVPIRDAAQFGGGVQATVVAVAATEGEGGGIGDLAGPTIKVDVRIGNRSGAPVDLNSVVVNAFVGNENSPAEPLLGDPRGETFSGTLSSGDAVVATYLFVLPSDRGGLLTITVSYSADQPVAVFRGDLPQG